MIRLRYRSTPDLPWVTLEIDDATHDVVDVMAKMIKILKKDPANVEMEQEREDRFQEMMTRRKKEKEAKKPARNRAAEARGNAEEPDALCPTRKAQERA